MNLEDMEMKLEELIYQWFTGHEPVAGRLTKYSGRPAIFFQTSPADVQKGWENRCQYPRIVYVIDMQADQERKSAGTMQIDIFCDEAGIPPEEIEPAVKECLKDLIIKPDGGSPYCFAWSRTDSFELSSKESGADTRVIGTEIRFDVLEYTSQEATDPDPVAALERYMKNIMPDAFILGVDSMGYFKVADAEAPVFYCRMESIEKQVETNTITWMDGQVKVHVICLDISVRQKFLMSLANQLSLDGKVTMLDGSPMRINKLLVNNKADYLKDGQISIGVHYGLLRYREKKPEMRSVKIAGMTGGFYGIKK